MPLASPDPAVDQEVDVVQSDLVNGQVHLAPTPDNARLHELEDVEEKREEDDRENVDKQPLLEARVVKLQSPRYWDPMVANFLFHVSKVIIKKRFSFSRTIR